MASPGPSPPKSPRFQSPLLPCLTQCSSHGQGESEKTVIDGSSVPFPWNDAVPEKIRKWFEAVGKSHNTAPEYVFVGALVTTAVLMGPHCYVKVRETYREPTNLFAICIGHPGSGKSQAYAMTVREPLQSLPSSTLSSILVDDYTKKGLFMHLQKHEGRALLAHEEMGAFFDLVQKRQLEGNAECQLYCRLYDGGQWVSSTGVKKSDGRQKVDKTCVCISGYVQPQPFKEKIYPQLTESDDGFIDRLLLCFPKTRILLEEEVDDWCDKLHTYNLTSLVEPLRMIAEWHTRKTDSDYVYEFDEEGKQVYKSFANEMAQIMNDMWESGLGYQGNVSKDKRTMIRLCGNIHVLYKALNTCLTGQTTLNTGINPPPSAQPNAFEQSQVSPESPSSPGTPPPLPPPISLDDEATTPVQGEYPIPDARGPSTFITEEEARMAVALTEYFQEQRRVYEQICANKYHPVQVDQNSTSRSQSIPANILLSKGAFCTSRSVIRSTTTKKKPTSVEVIDEMKKLSESGVGKFVISDKDKVYYKPLPDEINRERIEAHIDFAQYKENFKADVDGKYITQKQFNRLLSNSADKDTLMSEYGYQYK